jgi:hypothetical protein
MAQSDECLLAINMCKEIPDWLFAKMLRQAGLSRKEFEQLLKDP